MSPTNQITYQEFINNILKTRGRFSCGDEYHERHHIAPKCMGGGNEEENLIDLYAREHYIAHELLAKENPHSQALNFVWALMSSRIESKIGEKCIKSAEDYETARKALSEFLSVNRKGKKFTDEHKSNLSKALKGRVFTEEQKENMRKNHYHGPHPMKGKHHSEKSRKNMSAAAQNRSGQWRKRQSEAQRGKKHSDKWKKMMSERNSGENNPNYDNHKLRGKGSPVSLPIICDGMLFYGYRECAEYYGLSSYGNLCSFLTGGKPMPKKWKDRGLHIATEEELNAFN